MTRGSNTELRRLAMHADQVIDDAGRGPSCRHVLTVERAVAAHNHQTLMAALGMEA
jgi:hypothetical protein